MALQAIRMCINATISFADNGNDTCVRLHRPGSSEVFPNPDDFDAMAQKIPNEGMSAHVAFEEALGREELARAEAARVGEAREARKERAKRPA